MFPNPVQGPIHPASWQRPSGNLEFKVTSPFGARVIVLPDGKKSTAPHNGLDIGNGLAGASVLAQAAGIVVEARPTLDGVVTIQTPDRRWRLVLAHMTGITVGLGARVSVGQVIGKVGNVGVSTAAHLHFENKELVNGVYVPRDPWLLLTQNGEDMSKSTATITLFADGPHTLNIPAGGKVDGYSLDGLVKSQTFPTGSSSVADGMAKITQDPQKAPNGTFYRCSGGIFAGLYLLPSQLADAGPVNPVPPSGGGFTQEDVNEAYNAGLAAAQAAVEAIPDK